MPTDRDILRGLAAQYAVYARGPLNAERWRLHRAVNDRRMERPVVLIDEIPWGEYAAEPELVTRCTGEVERGYETFFRRKLFQWKRFPGDMALTAYVPVRKRVSIGSNGITVQEHTMKQSDGAYIVSHEYADQFEQDADLDKLHMREVTYDKAGSLADLAYAGELFGDIVPVKLCGLAGGYGLGAVFWDEIAMYRGVSPMLADLYDRPEFMHKMVGRLTDIFLNTLRRLEELDCLEAGAPALHCTAAAVSDLDDVINDGHVTPRQVWGRGTAQIFASVSPAMHDEFDIQYMKRAMAPFGLVYYGCCEPLHNKIDILEQLPNLRKIGVTPWADPDVAAERMGGRYVMAFKPNPAFVAGGGDLDAARRELRRGLAACRRNGTSCDVVLKDISTTDGDWRRLSEWEAMAMAEATR